MSNGFHLLENMHGAQKRVAERPAKRVKTDHDSSTDDPAARTSAKSGPRYGNAGVGAFFKPKPEEAINGSTFPSASIDLTNDDTDDEDLQITGVRNADDKEVCYGMVDGYIHAHLVPKPAKAVGASQFAANQWPVFKVGLKHDQERGMSIECTDPHGQMFGYIESQLAEALAPAMDGFPKSRYQCRLLTRPQKPGEWVHQPCSEKLRVVINIYGLKRDVEKVGRWLGQKNIWLKTPMVPDAGVEIVNPHAQKRKPLSEVLASGKHHVVNTTRTLEEATSAVSKLFDYQADENIDIPETDGPPAILTTLLRHQKQALTFMLRQEQPRAFSSEEAGNTSLWRKKVNHRGREIFEEVVTGIQVDEEPKQVLGGLLADVMGLGKTIQALALIAFTMAEAASFGQEKLMRNGDDELPLVCHSRATLLVVPLSTVKNWEDQIKEHTKSGSILYHVYHGQGREKNPFKLSDNDVVITTYGTAQAEMESKTRADSATSPLLRVRWFRIMLDEAHTIRESKSGQARAMFKLFADRRWALTGTPIQNRLEDLGSICSFLRLYPYDSMSRFNQYIKGPAQSGDTGFLKRLRVMVDSFTLRRNRDQIELPDRQDLVVELEFSEEERRLHEFFRQYFSVKVKEMNLEKKENGTGLQYNRVLQGITVLRLICAHGKELLKENELNTYRGSSADQPLEVEDDPRPPEIDQKKAYEHFNMLVEADVDRCALCQRKLSDELPGTPSSESGVGNANMQAVVLSCLDTLCADCFFGYKEHFDSSQENGEGVGCPNGECNYTISPKYIPIPKDFAEQLKAVPEETTNSTATVFKNGFYSGPHTKTKQLLNDIKEMNADSVPLVEKGEPPIKMVIFSEFTSHLDLIGKALSDAGHSFVRIDGSMSLANRRKVLDALNKDNATTILLASIKAAGQGLNLTAASRCCLMEPMWNPAAEAQAIDRIYRLGQRREVMVKRYRMRSSMEDKIVALQEKKKKLAEFSMEKKAMQQELSKKDRDENSLKSMLEFFKA